MTPHYANPAAPPVGKDEIKAWLRARGHDRSWLAAHCGVGKRTVDNWLSSPRAIPPKALFIISALMKGSDRADPADSILQNLVLQVDETTFERWNRAALARNMTIKDWATDALDRAARTYPVEMPLPVSKVAEESDSPS